MQLQHFLSWNKANIKHSCKSQLYRTKLHLDIVECWLSWSTWLDSQQQTPTCPHERRKNVTCPVKYCFNYIEGNIKNPCQLWDNNYIQNGWRKQKIVISICFGEITFWGA